MSFQTINPATGEIVRTFPMASDAEVATALKTADDRYNNDWKLRTVAERAQIVKRAAALLRQNANEYAGYLTLEMVARPRLVLQTFKTMVGIAMRSKADNPRLNPNFPGDRPAAANRTMRARFKSRCNVAGERRHASSTLRSFLERWTSLASEIIPMLNHNSRFKKSGY